MTLFFRLLFLLLLVLVRCWLLLLPLLLLFFLFAAHFSIAIRYCFSFQSMHLQACFIHSLGLDVFFLFHCANHSLAKSLLCACATFGLYTKHLAIVISWTKKMTSVLLPKQNKKHQHQHQHHGISITASSTAFRFHELSARSGSMKRNYSMNTHKLYACCEVKILTKA